MNQYQQFIRCLQQFPSVEWVNQYFDLLKRLLLELNIQDDDPRLALSLTSNDKIPVNLGQRYVLEPHGKEFIRCIVPAAFNENMVKAKLIGYFCPKTTRDTKWVELKFPFGAIFPSSLYNACLDACRDILKKSKKSGYRKHHVSLLYDFTMEPDVRTEMLDELKT
jgi:hypothetical protein